MTLISSSNAEDWSTGTTGSCTGSYFTTPAPATGSSFFYQLYQTCDGGVTGSSASGSYYNVPSGSTCAYKVNWVVQATEGGSGQLIIKTAGGIIVVDDTSVLDETHSGYVCLEYIDLPYQVTGSWKSGSSNVVRYRVCYVPTGYELFYSGDIDNVVSDVRTTIFPAGESLVYLTATTDITPPPCAV